MLDIGTGSGAIALAIADEHPGAKVAGTDTSTDALAVAEENVAATGLGVELVEGELFAGLDGPFDLVVSNPPYVAPDEVGALPPEVGEHEPRAALIDSGATDAIARGALSRLVPGGSLAFEVADGKAQRRGRRCCEGSATRRSRSGKISRDVSEWSTEERLVEEAVAAIGEGRPVVLPTDTVYGLCSSPLAPQSLSRLKQRTPDQPIALLAAQVEILLELVPELPEDVLHAPPARAADADPPEPRAALPALGRVASGHDRRARSRAPRRLAADRHAGRRGRRDEREPPRRPGSPAARRGSRGDPSRGRPGRGRRAARHAVDGRRPHRPRAADSARRRRARRRSPRRRLA